MLYLFFIILKMDTNQKSKKCSGCLDCSKCGGDNKFVLKLEVPKMKEIFDLDLKEILCLYDKILVKHIVDHYYDGQITDDILNKIRTKLKENKKNLYN